MFRHLSFTVLYKVSSSSIRGREYCYKTREMDGGDHVVLFPFMSKGHTIPILHVARLLSRRQFHVTVITTPANQPFIAQSLSDTSAKILTLPFPENISGVPAGVESTDKLPDMSLYAAFAAATEAMQPQFEQTLRTMTALADVSFIVSDGFLWWTQESADRLGIPRISFYGMSGYASSVCRSVMVNGTAREAETERDQLLTVPDFPWVKVRRSDFHGPFTEREPEGHLFELAMKQIDATTKSYGMIYNSFYELEPAFADYWNRHSQPRGWWVGPLCLAQPPKTQLQVRPWWAEWLDNKSSVLYVAFGSQAEISPEQLKEIAIGLERSEVSFMWVTRANESELPRGYDERVKDRGVIVREWVDQTEILAHERVQGFLSHCGWNSVMESVCAGVPILAWPMMAEQPLNARMVVEEIKVGLRVETGYGTVKGSELEEAVRELMEGDKGKEARKAVKKYAEEARRAVEEGGSSWRALGELLDDINKTRKLKM